MSKPSTKSILKPWTWDESAETRPPPRITGEPAKVLPPDVRFALVQASQTVDPHDRSIAIDAVTARAKTKYPHLFIKE